jgi:hypothetical protein
MSDHHRPVAALPADKKAVYASWVPEVRPAVQPGREEHAAVLPRVRSSPRGERDLHGGGPISYWNAYVAVTVMEGAAIRQAAGIDVKHSPDMVTRTSRCRAPQHNRRHRLRPAASMRRAQAWTRAVRQGVASCHVGGWARTTRREAARACGNRRRRRVRGAHGKQGVPHNPAARSLAARSVFPRRQRGNARRCRGALRPRPQARSRGGAAARSRGVSEFSVKSRSPRPEV